MIFSYTVRNPLVSNYEPYRQRRGAIYFEMASGRERFSFNSRYPRRVPLRILEAKTLRQAPFLVGRADYRCVRAFLPQLPFLTRPEEFPPDAYL